ncbi:DUF6274 family protein [Streptomyces sp. CBMA152]|uniref:DUF6274 family protein n=1 Tax=Streptomyces sp. CBMA152 TaxID=1896312 RepID=UPI0016609587|nr:DUF6274 family protein [Streptomyces sp. CBMA152]MBD0744068.1 hypothetical protein [Streptomyces sp. CBMA152]
MTASSARHETRALLRAHLSAASGYRHHTGRCPVCRKLLRLAMEPSALESALEASLEAALEPPAPDPAPVRPEDESPAER